jgi:hypothetical protein
MLLFSFYPQASDVGETHSLVLATEIPTKKKAKLLENLKFKDMILFPCKILKSI